MTKASSTQVSRTFSTPLSGQHCMSPEEDDDRLGPGEQEVLTEILEEVRKHVLREARKSSRGAPIDQAAIVRAFAELGFPTGDSESALGVAQNEDIRLRGDSAELFARLFPRGVDQASLVAHNGLALDGALAPPYTFQSVLGFVLARLSSGNPLPPGDGPSLPHWGSALCPRCMTLLAIRKPNVPPRRRWPC
jgi:hypothetical protein